ncbi:parallel beta-helix repeat protein [Methanofollis sp. W23]|uniref:NosD domain-containing protein n=1 Tax=Methanofollis sp. W23 TaxID=2817849 RepID=UPI001AE45B94|nr:NosD domain-containing protein [Methanofollis sp. W23]MBP2145988.1 parallel beta-helix repeat protein [Methanofollis sp. W23]
MKKSIGIFCLILLALLIAPAAATTLYVDDDGGEGVYTTIQGALDAAAEGDTIIIRAGTYSHFQTDKPYLTISGEGADLVTVDLNGVSLEIRGTETTLEGLTILKASMLWVYGQDCIIRDCVFDAMTGSNAIDIRASNCTVVNNKIQDLKSDSTGINVKGVSPTIVNNTFVNFPGRHSALYLRTEAANATVEDNVFENCTCPYTTTLQYATGCTITNNTFKDNTGDAIRIWKAEATNNTITRNTFIRNGGIIYWREAGDNNRIFLNTFTDNKGAFTIHDGTVAPTLTHWNSTAPLTYTYDGTTHTGYLGNSWSDYEDIDEDGDGVIDTQYDLPDGLGTDYAPLTAAGEKYNVLVPQTRYVDDDGGDGVYTTIQEAVDAAEFVDTIVVRNGTYTENVLVDKGLTIRAENGTEAVTVTAASPEKPVFDLKADGITVEGFSVRGPTNEHVAGIESVGYDDCRIIGNDCGGACYNGIHLGGDATGTLIEANTCHDNTRRGISLRDDVTGTTVYNNTCWNNADDELCVKDQAADNVIWANAFFGTVECLNVNTYHSPDEVTYTYDGTDHTGYVGNYYSGYEGIDEDNNGIGDDPMSFGDYKDEYPMMGIWQGDAIATPEPILTTVSIEPETFEAETGETWQFNATGLNWDGTEIPGPLVFTWASSEPDVGTVNETGWFEAVAPGTATLTAACDGVEGTAQVTVVAPDSLPSIEIIRYAPDGITVEEKKSVTIRWMQRHLPVLGGENGTELHFQSITLDEDDLWNPEETINLDKINNTVKGTALADLCDLVGGVYEGGEIQFTGRDKFPGKLPSSAVLAPHERQGPAMIAWWDAEDGEYPEWSEGPQLFFFTPDRVFGNDDMRVCFDEAYHHYWMKWPSAAGMSVKKIATIKIVPEPREDWNLDLSGAVVRTIDRSYYEQAVSCSAAKHGATWTDDGKTWSGVPLWLLCGWVDDADQHAPFRDDLADAGYTVVLTDYGDDGIAGTEDDRAVEFASAEVKKNNNIILANEINQWPLEEGDWPLKLVGDDVPAEKRLGSVDAIRLDGLTGSDEGMALTLHRGWNFVSVPRTLAPGNDTAEIFAGIDSAGHSILTFDAATGLWKTLGKNDTVRPLDGIWIYATQSTSTQLIFDPAKPETPPTKRLTEGWNAIGYSDTNPEPTRDALASVKDTWAILIGYDAESQAYEHSAINGAVGSHTDTLPMIPGKGYWLYVRADGTLAAIST